MGFVGKNGAGKSTTLRSIMNIISPTAGSIQVLGLNSKTHAKEIKKQVSYVPSEAAFYDGVTAGRLLNFAAGFAGTGADKVAELAEYFELDLSKNISQLSLGNRKKVSIVQGFLKDAELIILDEPTNGLDPLMQDKFFSLLQSEVARGKTAFLSSHNLSEVDKYCNRVAIIKDGQIVKVANMKDVKASARQTVYYKTADGTEQRFVLEGSLNELVAKLHTLNLTQLEISAHTAQDEFIEYYKTGEEEAKA